jgi:hypothetical protein
LLNNLRNWRTQEGALGWEIEIVELATSLSGTSDMILILLRIVVLHRPLSLALQKSLFRTRQSCELLSISLKK